MKSKVHWPKGNRSVDGLWVDIGLRAESTLFEKKEAISVERKA